DGLRAFGPFGPYDARAVLRLGHDGGPAALGPEFVGKGAVERSFQAEGRGDPHTRHAGGLQDFDLRGHLEGAPLVCRRGLRMGGWREHGIHDAGGGDAGETEEITAVHGGSWGGL